RDVRAVVAIGALPDAGGPTVVAGGPFAGDGWFVRAAIHSADTVTEVCFGVLGPPQSECMPAAGDALQTRMIDQANRQALVGVVRDPRIVDIRVIVNGTSHPVVIEHPEIVRVQGGYRVFAWRAAWTGVATVSARAGDGEVLAGTSTPLS